MQRGHTRQHPKPTRHAARQAARRTPKRSLASRAVASRQTSVHGSTSTRIYKSSTHFTPNTTTRRLFSADALPGSAQLFQLPMMSPTMETGCVAEWYKQPGDLVKANESLLALETDKASLPVDMTDDVYLAAILVPGGTGKHLPVGTPIAVVVDEIEDIPAAQAYAKTLLETAQNGVELTTIASKDSPTAAASNSQPQEDTSATKIAPVAAAAAPSSSSSSSSQTYVQTRNFSPAVALLLQETNVDPTSVRPTGPMGHLLKGDIINAIADGTVVYLSPQHDKQQQQQATPAAAAAKPAPKTVAPPAASATSTGGRRSRRRTFNDIPVSTQTIERNQAEIAANVPHTHNSIDISISALSSMLQTFSAETNINTALVSIVARSAGKFIPSLTAASGAVRHGATVANIAVSNHATQTGGLLSPVDALRFGAIQQRTQQPLPLAASDDAVASTAAPTLQVHLFTGCDPSARRVDERVVPQGVLSVSIGAPQVHVVGVAKNGVEQLEQQSLLSVTLNADNRLCDEQTSAQILQDIKQLSQSPLGLLI